MPIKIKDWSKQVSCMVCKMCIINSKRPFKKYFRACKWLEVGLGIYAFSNIYLVHNTGDGVRLTGLGFCEPGNTCKVPNDEHARWDTMGDDWSLLENLNGYVFHDRCWNLIMEHFSPWEFNFKSLYEALEYLPWPRGSAALIQSYWLSLITNYSFTYLEPWLHETMERYGCRKRDPFILPTLEQLMQPSKSFPELLQGNAKWKLHHNPTDSFNALPLELREGIAMQLPTHDVLNLRCASRAMVPMFSNSTFWATRFAINGERGFVYPLVKHLIRNARNDIDWRLLYHCTCKIKCGSEFDFHIRIWESLSWLRDATMARYSKVRMPLCFAGRAMQHYHNTRYPGTCIKTVDIAPSLYQMTVSAVSIGGSVYVTGLEFFFTNQPSILIGYKAPGARVMTRGSEAAEHSDYRYPGLLSKTNIGHLKGFALHRTTSGVQGIEIIQHPKRPSFVGFVDGPVCNNGDEFSLDTVSKVIGTFDVS